jgi:hypothetical protein
MPQTKKIAFFITQGRKTAFVNTLPDSPIFLSGGKATAFFATLGQTPIFLTGNRRQSFLTTLGTTPIFITANKKVAFVVTPDTSVTRLLVPQIGTLEVNSAQTQITLTDGTGTYNPSEPTQNPGGYNPESAGTSAFRPKRSQVFLWTVYKLRSRPESEGYGNNTQTPTSQAEKNDVPYEYTLTLPTEEIDQEAVTIKGLYEIIMIAAPNGTPYPVGDVNLAQVAATYPGWYVTSSPIMVDSDVANCLNNMRYKFLQGVMCGRCDDEYFNTYGIYVGMLNAMEVGEWPAAVEYYDKLKAICLDMGCNDSCGC